MHSSVSPTGSQAHVPLASQLPMRGLWRIVKCFQIRLWALFLGFSGWKVSTQPVVLIDWAPRPSRALGTPQINRTYTASKTSLSSLP